MPPPNPNPNPNPNPPPNPNPGTTGAPGPFPAGHPFALKKPEELHAAFQASRPEAMSPAAWAAIIQGVFNFIQVLSTALAQHQAAGPNPPQQPGPAASPPPGLG